MSTDHILSTKLVIPANPLQMVVRPRLELPDSAPRIILVCAPAGYGKTTLAASWAVSNRSPSAWLSLDEGDNDPTRFLMHFITAIQLHHAGFGKVVIDMLGCSPPPPIAGLMRSLVNQLCHLPGPLCLILDDLHLVTGSAVHDAITFLVDHQPPQLQLIFVSRSDPPFSLARLRGQRQLVEYRATDLRFTLDEAQAFCNEVMHFGLPEKQIATLTTRTEGWIVGLQLAAVSLLNASNKSSFIDSFAGDNRHITDFLLDEVLRSRSEEMQNFLLYTSLLERFNASLCDAVTGRNDSRAMIDEMERTNMFTVGLDNQRVWYRYHHLFTSLLYSRLQQACPDMMETLHRRASHWFSENNLITEAINHAIKGADFVFAADLMEQHGGMLFSHGRITTVLTWAEQLPQHLLAQRPALSIQCAWGNFYLDDLRALDRHIRAAALCLPGAQGAPYGSKDRTMFGQLAILRGCHHGCTGNLDGAISQFKEALTSIPPDRTLYRVAAVCLGICYLVARRLDDAQRLLEKHTSISEVKFNLMVPITAVLALGRLHLLRGDLLAAKQTFSTAMRECLNAGWQDFPACGLLHIGLGELAYEMNDLALAEQHLLRGIDMTSVGMGCFNAWGHALLAQTRLAQGAVENILPDQSEAMVMKYSGRFVVDPAPTSAAAGKLWLLQGRMDAAAQWMSRAQLPTFGDLSIGREAEYIVLARYMIALKKTAAALELLEKLWDSAEEGKRLSVMIEVLNLKAIALQIEGDSTAALTVLKKSVALAENTNLLRLFINDSACLSGLLKKLARGTDYTSHAHYLLSQIAAQMGQPKQEQPPLLPVLLSKKEKEVVTYILSGSSNQQIAEMLFISSHTVNSHIKSIYSKLGVSSKLQAIERLRKLGSFS